jgi:hypothetical protein
MRLKVEKEWRWDYCTYLKVSLFIGDDEITSDEVEIKEDN